MMDKLNGSILIEGDDLLEKWNTIWDKVSVDKKIDLLVKKKIFKNKNKISWDKITNFYDKKKLLR